MAPVFSGLGSNFSKRQYQTQRTAPIPESDSVGGGQGIRM